MIRHKNIEITIGIFFLLAFTALLFITIQTTNMHFETHNLNYLLHAKFENINGLKSKAPVRIGGVKIGEVQKIRLNPENFLAEVSFLIYNKEIQIPTDSSVSILTEGLLGSKFISITPGLSDQALQNNEFMKKTYPAIVFERILSQAIAYISSKE